VFIIKRSDFVNTASGIVTLCKCPSGMQVEKELFESGMQVDKELFEFLLNLHTGRPPTESDYTRSCINKI